MRIHLFIYVIKYTSNSNWRDPLKSDASLFSDASCSDINSEDIFSDASFSEGSDDEGYRTNPTSLPSKDQEDILRDQEEQMEKNQPPPQPQELGKCSLVIFGVQSLNGNAWALNNSEHLSSCCDKYWSIAHRHKVNAGQVGDKAVKEAGSSDF